MLLVFFVIIFFIFIMMIMFNNKSKKQLLAAVPSSSVLMDITYMIIVIITKTMGLADNTEGSGGEVAKREGIWGTKFKKKNETSMRVGASGLTQ